VLALLWNVELQIAESMENSDEHDEDILEFLILACRQQACNPLRRLLKLKGEVQVTVSEVTNP
jgi:hypothetical protein